MKKRNEKYFQKKYQDGTKVVWGKSVERQLVRLPTHISEKFQAWATDVRLIGIQEASGLSRRAAPRPKTRPAVGEAESKLQGYLL